MFSLIVTIIAIVLVAALALATLYYGATSATEARVRARAATLVVQATQVDAALVLFRQENGRWPTSPAELVTGNYLKTIPVAPPVLAMELPAALEAFVPTAYAASDTLPWAQVVPNTPQFWVLRGVSQPVCQAINRQVRGDNGIYNAAIPGVKVQCFGQNSNYTVLLHYAATDSAQPLEVSVPAQGGTPTLIVSDSGSGWAITPSSPSSNTSPGNGSGTTPTPTPDPTPTPTPTPDPTPAPTQQTPVITSLTPASGSVAGGTTVTVTGTNFDNTAQVVVGSTAVTPTVTSTTQLTFVTPAGTAGATPVTISVGSKTSAAGSFNYTPVLAINSITPSFGPMAGGTVVTLTGSNFQTGTKVSVNGVAVTTTIVDSTRLTFTTPAGTEGATPVTVALGSVVSPATSFNYVAPVTGTVTTLGKLYIGNNLANVAADDQGVYVFSGQNFYRTTYAGVTTTFKKSGWGTTCADSNIQFVAWNILANGDLAVMANCSTSNTLGFVTRVTNTGTLVGTARTDNGILSALTQGSANNFHYNRRDGAPYDRNIRSISANGTYGSASVSGGPDTTGMAADPTSNFVYYVYPSTPTNMVLLRCAPSDSGCTSVGNVGLLNYPSGTTGVALSAKPYLAFDGNGQLYAATPTAIYLMDKTTGASTVYAGTSGSAGTVDGTGTTTRLNILAIGRGLNGKIYIHDRGTSGEVMRRLD